MLVSKIITNEFNSLKPADSVQIALITMEDYGVSNLPVVQNGVLLGYVRNSELACLDPMLELSAVQLLQNWKLAPENSLFEAIAMFGRTGLEVLAVEGAGEYQGLVWVKDLVIALGNSKTIQGDGAVLAIRTHQRNYSIAQLGRIVESSDGKILGMWTWNVEGSDHIDLLIKLNIKHIDNLINLLESNDYETLYTMRNSLEDYHEDRYQSLLKYLDI